jgi:peptide/nickel transport system substrate-binding protein
MKLMVVMVLALAMPLVASAAPAGKIVIAQGVDPTTLDMMNQSESPASNVGRHIFDALYERDPSLKIVPVLATDMPKLVAPTAWEVKLRKGVKFHNGEDFDANSAKFSLERLAQGQGKLRGATFFAPIDRVEVVDPLTIRVHTKKPWPTFTAVMTFVQGAMYPPKAYADKDTAFINKTPIGTGPYKFVRWSKDEEIVLEANAAYFRGAPKIKTVVFRPIPRRRRARRGVAER